MNGEYRFRSQSGGPRFDPRFDLGSSAAPKKQGGVALLEALIAILVFSLGILSVLGIQAASIRMAAEAQYRTKATLLANRLIGQMWTYGGDIGSLKNEFAQNCANCSYKLWLDDVKDPVKGGLPGVEAGDGGSTISTLPSLTITESGSADHGVLATVEVTIRWRTPAMSPDEARQHRVTSQISRNPV